MHSALPLHASARCNRSCSNDSSDLSVVGLCPAKNQHKLNERRCAEFSERSAKRQRKDSERNNSHLRDVLQHVVVIAHVVQLPKVDLLRGKVVAVRVRPIDKFCVQEVACSRSDDPQRGESIVRTVVIMARDVVLRRRWGPRGALYSQAICQKISIKP